MQLFTRSQCPLAWHAGGKRGVRLLFTIFSVHLTSLILITHTEAHYLHDCSCSPLPSSTEDSAPVMFPFKLHLYRTAGAASENCHHFHPASNIAFPRKTKAETFALVTFVVLAVCPNTMINDVFLVCSSPKCCLQFRKPVILLLVKFWIVLTFLQKNFSIVAEEQTWLCQFCNNFSHFGISIHVFLC